MGDADGGANGHTRTRTATNATAAKTLPGGASGAVHPSDHPIVTFPTLTLLALKGGEEQTDPP